uniref:MHC class II beta chain N-terminal domain-containing protein n=1 Tax=Pundamilia nyererei TaxID=303518 RepID=A0A3B4FAY9_9CICH
MASSFLCLTHSLMLCLFSDGFKMFWVHHCDFNSTEPKDIKYVLSYYYNKIEFSRFDSDVGKFVGFTEYGVKTAEEWNSGAYLTQMKAQKERYCQHNIGVWNSNILPKSGECAGLCDIIRCSCYSESFMMDSQLQVRLW